MSANPVTRELLMLWCVPFSRFVNSVDIWNKNQQLGVSALPYILIVKLLKDLKSIHSKDETYWIRIKGFIWSSFPRKPRLLHVRTVSWESVNSRRLYSKLHLEMKTLIFPKYIIIIRYDFVYLYFWKYLALHKAKLVKLCL